MSWEAFDLARKLNQAKKLKDTPTTNEFVQHTTQMGGHVVLTSHGQARVNSFKNEAAANLRQLRQEHLEAVAHKHKNYAKEKTSSRRKQSVGDLAASHKREVKQIHKEHRQDIQALKLKTVVEFGGLMKNLHQEGHLKFKVS